MEQAADLKAPLVLDLAAQVQVQLGHQEPVAHAGQTLWRWRKPMSRRSRKQNKKEEKKTK
jgi:hypothetical protein